MENTTKTPTVDVSSAVNAAFRRIRKDTSEYVVFTVQKGSGIKQVFGTLHPAYAPYNQFRKDGYILASEITLFSSDIRANDSQNSLHQYALNLFAKKRELIDSLYVEDISRLPLVYSIILKEDTFENRDSLYDVLIDLQIESSADDIRFRFLSPTMTESISGQIPISIHGSEFTTAH